VLTALNVARESGMIPPCHNVILLTAQHAADNSDHKLLLKWSSLSNLSKSDINISQKSNGDDVQTTQVSVCSKRLLH
jgi:hypothetical protein